MLPTVEKNDVNISPLFAWSKEFKIEMSDKEIPVFMRVVGDSDINRARVAALRRSAELRKKLRDPNSDERFAYIKDIEDIEVDSMISVIIVFTMRDLSEDARKEVKIKPPKAPRSDAKTELQEKYQLEIDEYPEKYQEEVRKILEKKIDALKKQLSKLSPEELHKKYEQSMTDELCERELMNSFREWTTYLSAYKDEGLKERFFESFEEFSNLPSDLKGQFMREYSLLELTMDDLKKLLPVTQ